MMNIYARAGDKVVFTGKNGTDFDQENARKYLEIGKTYKVVRTEVHNWSSTVQLEGFHELFNTVMFDDPKSFCSGNKATEKEERMERKYVTGQAVVYVDHFGVRHDALITKWWNGESTIESYLSQYGDPGCNLVYVVKDESKIDSCGRQIHRETSVIHKTKQAAHGNYYCWPDEI